MNNTNRVFIEEGKWSANDWCKHVIVKFDRGKHARNKKVGWPDHSENENTSNEYRINVDSRISVHLFLPRFVGKSVVLSLFYHLASVDSEDWFISMVPNEFSIGPNAEPDIDSSEAHLGDQKETEQKT